MSEDIYVTNGDGIQIDYNYEVMFMDPTIREYLDMQLAPCTNQEFYDAYCKAHEEKYGVKFSSDTVNSFPPTPNLEAGLTEYLGNFAYEGDHFDYPHRLSEYVQEKIGLNPESSIDSIDSDKLRQLVREYRVKYDRSQQKHHALTR